MVNQKMARDFLDTNKKRRGVTLDEQTWAAIDWLAARANAKWPELFLAWIERDSEGAKVNLTAVIRSGVIADLMDATVAAPRLDDDSLELLKLIETRTGMSPVQTIGKLFPAHLEELWAYLTWLEKLSERPTKAQKLGPYLLQSYGPENLIQGIKRLDPTYETEGEQFAKSMTTTN